MRYNLKVKLFYLSSPMRILKISPKGQITIPKEYRDKFIDQNVAFEIQKNSIVLKPVKIEVIQDDNFFEASESALDFWKNDQDDIYAQSHKS